MLDLDPADTSLGALWRDVVNFLGDREFAPDLWIALFDAILPKWDGYPGYIGSAAKWLKSNRSDIRNSVAQNQIGWRLWTERSDLLRAYAQKIARRPVTHEDLRRWWIDGARGEYAEWDATRYKFGSKRSNDYKDVLELSDEELRIVSYQLVGKGEPPTSDWLVAWLHNHLDWIEDLDNLRLLAHKTWPADVAKRQRWTQAELEWVNNWFEDQQPYLMAQNDEGPVDPFELEIFNDEQRIGFGMSDLSALILVFTRATVVDFAEEILEQSRRGNARGSLSCVECGRFVGRRALGYGQLYCSDRCKKRVAKRRYRGRVAEKPAGRELLPLPPYEPTYLRKTGQEGESA